MNGAPDRRSLSDDLAMKAEKKKKNGNETRDRVDVRVAGARYSCLVEQTTFRIADDVSASAL